MLHDAPITKLRRWLWQCVYIALLLILQICADNLLICPETAAALSQPYPRQFLMSKPRLTDPPKTASANVLPDSPKSQCNKPRNSSLITQSLETYLTTRDNCSWLEQSEASSANVGKNWFSFIFLTIAPVINYLQ